MFNFFLCDQCMFIYYNFNIIKKKLTMKKKKKIIIIMCVHCVFELNNNK